MPYLGKNHYDVVVAAVAQSCNLQLIFGGIQELIVVFNWYTSCI